MKPILLKAWTERVDRIRSDNRSRSAHTRLDHPREHGSSKPLVHSVRYRGMELGDRFVGTRRRYSLRSGPEQAVRQD